MTHPADTTPSTSSADNTTFPSPAFANLREPIRITGTTLPHWYQEGKVLFSTFRLAGSLPRVATDEYRYILHEWQQQYPKPWDNATKETFTEIIGRWLEQCLHSNKDKKLLLREDVRKTVEEAFHHKDGKSVIVYAYVIMPNHVHVLYAITDDKTTPEEFLGNVKRYTARVINRKLGISGSVWQKGCFDRLVRNANAFRQHLEYIIDNPKNLQHEQYSLYVHPTLKG